MKTIAQQLNIKDFPFEIKDKSGNIIYTENSNGYWFKKEYDKEGNETYLETSTNYWRIREFNENGRVIYFKDST